MTVAYFDCFGGIAGDMALGALVDAGGELSVVEAAVEALGLSQEVRVHAAREERGHLGGTRLRVEVADAGRRPLPELERMVAEADLPAAVRDRTLAALDRLGRVESELHGVTRAELHLHELGGADTLVDLAGTFWLLESLAVDRVFASPLPYPSTGATTGDPPLPLPAPATQRVLAGTGAVLEPSSAAHELVTPTGAAILATCAVFARPSITLERIGYGFGGHPAPGNALAVWLGSQPAAVGAVDVLETNLDDMAPNDLAALADDLFAVGALDVTITPVVMKKGRPGHVLSVLSAPELTGRLTQHLLRHSPTLGLRITRAPRVVADREVVEVKTPLGRARVKVKRSAGGTSVAAEHDDLRALAAASGRPLTQVRAVVELAARQQLGLPPS